MSNSKISSLTRYKQAIAIKKDIDDILPILIQSINQLNKYKTRYSIVRQSISTLDDLKTIFDIHKKNIDKVVANKGIIEDNSSDEH